MGWDEVGEQISRALAAMRAKEVATQGTNTTLEIALLEAIVDMDSEQADAVATLGTGGMISYSDDGAVRRGQLQQIEVLETTFFGDGTGQTGLLAAMKSMPDPLSYPG